MSLSRVSLQRSFAALWGDLSRGPALTAPEMVGRLAEEYAAYCLRAEDASGDGPARLYPGRFVTALQLKNGLSVGEAARRFDRAFLAFWRGVEFRTDYLITTPPAGCPNVGGTGLWSAETASQVTSVQEGILRRKLVPIFEARKSFSAHLFAQALDEATKTAVRVTITGLDTTLPVPLMIQNNCTIR